MGTIKIACCAYRDWGLNISDSMKQIPGVEVVRIGGPEELSLQRLESINPEIVFFLGWSWKVSKDIIDRYLCLCLHPSRLPLYRGGSPLQNQILNGEKHGAVSIFKLTEDMDAGPLCFQGNLILEDGIKSIFARMMYVGREAIKKIIDDYRDGESKFWKQIGEPTYYKRRKPEQSEITEEELNTMSAEQLYNKIRCLQTPYPNAFISCVDGKRLYLTEAHLDG